MSYMSHVSRGSKVLRFSLASMMIAGAALEAGCSGSGSREGEGDNAGTNAAALIVSPDLVISQVYGGGGNAGPPAATYTHDFVELFNRGTSSVSLNGKSLQYASSTGLFSNASGVVALPNVSVPAGSYFLVQLATGGAVGAALPAADLVVSASPPNLANSKAKVALVDTLLNACGDSTTPCTAGAWIDFVGYGAASQSEASPTGTTANNSSAARRGFGCVDTGDNSADFEVIVGPVARNSSTTAVNCANVDAGPAPVDAGTDSAATPDAGPTDAAATDGAAKTDAGKVDSGVKKDAAAAADSGDEEPPPEEEDDDAGTVTKSDAGTKRVDAGKSSATVTPSASSESSGCAVSSTGSRGHAGGVASSLGVLGLALAALTRRRRK